MSERERQIVAFLAGHGWAGATRHALAGDASFRRYERLGDGDRRAVLMDAPPGHEDVRPFIAIGRYLHALGYSAPEIHAADEAAGLLLLEDLGDDLYADALAAGADQEALYGAAVDVLVDLHAARPAGRGPTGPDVPAFDDARLHREVDRLVEWFLPAASGAEAPRAVRNAYSEAWTAVFPLARAVPEALVLFDYHSPNLIWLPERDGLRRVGLLDFQDAVRGPLTYDLVSLLEDARRDVPEPLARAMVARYLDARPELDRAAFGAAYSIMGAQRNCRIIGTFARLWRRDGKAGYLAHMPRVWRYLEHNLTHPALAPVKRWIDDRVPPDWRGAAPWAVT
jgi:aminoglycoside/choline kinase family phosphotransferase